MKFVSKVNNFRVVLKPGIEGSRVTGTAPVPGLYIKFEDGVAIVNDPNTIELLKQHPQFGNDFHEVDESEIDPYLKNRKSSEPEHDVIEIKYGHPEKNFNPKPRFTLTPELKEYIEAMSDAKANEKAQIILEEMIKKGEKKVVEDKKPVKKSTKKVADVEENIEI